MLSRASCTLHGVLWKTPEGIVVLLTSSGRTSGWPSLGRLSSAVTHSQVTRKLEQIPGTGWNAARQDGDCESKTRLRYFVGRRVTAPEADEDEAPLCSQPSFSPLPAS